MTVTVTHNDPFIDVTRGPYNARGDGVTDDTAAIQAAIDAVHAGVGGTVLFPPGNYRAVGLVLKSGVVLQGQPRPRGSGDLTYAVRLQAYADGIVIDTPSGSACDSAEINGFQILGNLSSGYASVGVRFRDANLCAIKNCQFHGFDDQAILVDSTAIHCIFEDIYTTQCLMDRARAAKSGAIDVDGTDHVFRTVVAGTSQNIEGTITSANLYGCAWVIRGQQMGFENCFAEISEVGFHLTSAANGNRFSICRADLNYGHGWEVNGSAHQFTACLALSNGAATTNTYDNWHFTSNSGLCLIDGCSASTAIANLPRYGFYDDAQSDANKNRFSNCLATGNGTAAYRSSTNSGSAFSFPAGQGKPLAVNSAVPDVTGYERFFTNNSAPTTITDFVGGVFGQRLLIVCQDSNTTVQHNAGIIFPNLFDRKLLLYHTYEFVRILGAWWYVETSPFRVSADNGDTAVTLAWGRDASTQRWATPLTANRAVDLYAPAAENGVRFRIVRTAAATGAFSLNVGTGPLKALAVGTWCDVEYSGSSWILTGYGAL